MIYANPRQVAIAYRSAGGPIPKIAQLMGRSKSTISVWVKGVVISSSGLRRLKVNRGVHAIRGSLVNAAKCSATRDVYREAGREVARQGVAHHMAACALYWAEGSKKRCRMEICNTDPKMLSFFCDFLRKYFPEDLTKMHATVVYHPAGMGKSEADLIDYWSEALGVAVHKVKAVPNMDKRVGTGKKKNRHEWGKCVVTLDSTAVVQHIYGAIEIYFLSSIYPNSR